MLSDTRGRILRAATERCEELGLRRVTMDDVARRAGLGRATVYRHFETKDALVQAVILAEAEQFFAALDARLAGYRRADERLAEGFAFALRHVRRHALLAKLLRTEPEALLPYLIGDSRLLEVTTEAVARRLPGDDDIAEEDARAAAEMTVRLVLSLALTPGSALDVRDAESARALARRFIVPGLSLAAAAPVVSAAARR